MTKLLYLTLVASCICAVSSCNTFIGLGRDVQSLGSGMVNSGHGRAWNEDSSQTAAPAQTPAPTTPAR